MKEVYLDNGATTKPSEGVVSTMVKVLTEDYGNPSSLHHKGMKAEDYIKESAEAIAKVMGVENNTIYFTSGGTESNNLALQGIAKAYNRKGKHMITTIMEHKSVSNCMHYLEDEELEITYLKVDKDGQINIDELKEAIRPDTILVSIMHVNNEVGAIQDLEAIGKAIKSCNADTLFHVDAIQSFTKLPVKPKKMLVDLVSISGHKYHGPKGSGALYIGKNVRVHAILHGGGHQRGMRSGTENVPGIAGLGVATTECAKDMEANSKHMYAIKEYCYNALTSNVEDMHLNGPSVSEGAPHILSVRFDDVRGEVLLHSLESKEIYISTGSACASNRPEEKSPTLAALGLGRQEIDETIRISFCKNTTTEDIDVFINELKQLIPQLRRFTRK